MHRHVCAGNSFVVMSYLILFGMSGLVNAERGVILIAVVVLVLVLVLIAGASN